MAISFWLLWFLLYIYEFYYLCFFYCVSFNVTKKLKYIIVQCQLLLQQYNLYMYINEGNRRFSVKNKLDSRRTFIMKIIRDFYVVQFNGFEFG